MEEVFEALGFLFCAVMVIGYFCVIFFCILEILLLIVQSFRLAIFRTFGQRHEKKPRSDIFWNHIYWGLVRKEILR